MSNRDTTRYNPRGLTPLNEAMGQLFRDAFTTSGGSLVPATGLGLNLYETDEGYLLQALLPGVNPDALTITAQENVLTLQGTTRIAAPEHARAIYVGTDAGDFRQQVQLPGDVDAERASADYRDGVLTLTLPKAAHAKARTIKVGGQAPSQQSAIEGRTT